MAAPLRQAMLRLRPICRPATGAVRLAVRRASAEAETERLARLARSGDVAGAERLAERLVRRAVATRGEAFGWLVVAAGRAEDAEAAAQWLQALAEAGEELSDEAFAWLLTFVGKDAAERWFDALAGAGPQAERVRHRLALHALAAAGDALVAERCLARLLGARVPSRDKWSAADETLHALATSPDPLRASCWLDRLDAVSWEPEGAVGAPAPGAVGGMAVAAAMRARAKALGATHSSVLPSASCSAQVHRRSPCPRPRMRPSWQRSAHGIDGLLSVQHPESVP